MKRELQDDFERKDEKLVLLRVHSFAEKVMVNKSSRVSVKYFWNLSTAILLQPLNI